MSEPLNAWHGENEEPRPRPYLIPDMQPAGDSDHAGHEPRTSGWFHRTASRSAPHTAAPTRATPSASPGPMSEEQRWLALRNGTHPLSLTWEQIEYSVARERIIDASTDEQYWRDTVLFDQAMDDDRYWHDGRLWDRPMDAEPEIDDPELG